MKSAKFTASPTGDCGLFNFCGILNFSFLTLPLFSLLFVGYNWDYFSVQVPGNMLKFPPGSLL